MKSRVAQERKKKLLTAAKCLLYARSVQQRQVAHSALSQPGKKRERRRIPSRDAERSKKKELSRVLINDSDPLRFLASYADLDIHNIFLKRLGNTNDRQVIQVGRQQQHPVRPTSETNGGETPTFKVLLRPFR